MFHKQIFVGSFSETSHYQTVREKDIEERYINIGDLYLYLIWVQKWYQELLLENLMKYSHQFFLFGNQGSSIRNGLPLI